MVAPVWKWSGSCSDLALAQSGLTSERFYFSGHSKQSSQSAQCHIRYERFYFSGHNEQSSQSAQCRMTCQRLKDNYKDK